MIRCMIEVEEAVRMISSTYRSKPLSGNGKDKNSPYGSRFDNKAKCLIAVECLLMPPGPLQTSQGWQGGMAMREVVVTWKLYLGLAFIIPTLERVTIGCFEVDGGVVGGDGEVFGGGLFGGGRCDLEVTGVAKSWEVLFDGVACRVVCGVVVGGELEYGAKRKQFRTMCQAGKMILLVGQGMLSTDDYKGPREDTWCVTRGKFVRWKGVRVTKASKHANVGVRGTPQVLRVMIYSTPQAPDARAKAEAATCGGDDMVSGLVHVPSGWTG
ncbi:hypothetical protein Tco_0872070 [Tanacetum coccineum]